MDEDEKREMEITIAQLVGDLRQWKENCEEWADRYLTLQRRYFALRDKVDQCENKT